MPPFRRNSVGSEYDGVTPSESSLLFRTCFGRSPISCFERLKRLSPLPMQSSTSLPAFGICNNAISEAGCPVRLLPVPRSKPHPARAARSPSPVQSIKAFAFQASRPLFDSVTTVSILRPEESRYAAVTHVCKRTATPASPHISSHTSFMYSGS